jgi:hypothetical protein
MAGSAIANFSGTDDFNDNVMDAGKWGTASPGISETNSRLEYAAAYSANNEEQWGWVANRGSYTQDWSVIVDAHSALDPSGWSDEMVNFGIRVKNSANPTGDLFELSFEIAQENGYGEFRAVIAEETTDGEEGADITQNIGAVNAVTLCISFDAKTKRLSAVYDIGSGYVPLYSFSVTSWDMTEADQFSAYLGFSSESRSVAPGDIYGDNFMAKPTAVDAGIPDNQAPVVTRRSPVANPAAVNEGASVAFSLTANDSTDPVAATRGMSNITWHVDGVLKQETRTGAPNAITSAFTLKTDTNTVQGAAFRDVPVKAVALDRQGGATETNWTVRVNNVPAAQTITFPALPVRALGDADFAPGARASSGMPLTYASSSQAVAQVVGGLIHIVGAGTAVITASQPGNFDLKAATPMKQTLTVKARLTMEVPGGGGRITASPSSAGLYAPGTKITLTATPSNACTFLRWDDGSQTAARSLTMPGANTTVTAFFWVTTNVPKPVIADPGPQQAMVGVAFRLPLDITSASLPAVTVAGLPAGLVYSAPGRAVVGVPQAAVTNKMVTIVARNVNRTPTTNTFTVTVSPLPAWAQGSFSGWFDDGALDFGTVSADVTAQGKVTGRFALRGTNYAFAAASYARRDGDGTLWIATNAAAGKAVRPMTFAVSNHEAAVPPNLAVAAGWFGSAETGEPATMYRAVWKDAGMAAFVTNTYTGYYTATLPGGAAYGSGYLMLTVDKLGGVKTTGKLADGTAVSLSGPLILDEAGRVFAVLYTAPAAYGGGCLFGLAEFFKASADVKVIVRLLDGGPFAWESRNPLATGTCGAGFGRAPGLAGGWYDTLGNLYTYYANRTLSVGTEAAPAPELIVGTNRYDSAWWDPDGIAVRAVTNGPGVMTGLAAPAAGAPLRVGANVYDYASRTNAVGLTIGLTRATGFFKGSFKAWFDYAATHTSSSIPCEGVLTPEREDRADGVAGRGYFLWADKGQYTNALNRVITYPFNWSYDLKLLLSEPGE